MDALAKATILRKAPTDISNYKDKCFERFEGKLVKYDSISLNVIHRYVHILRQNSEIIQMQKRYYMRPDYVAYDFYGTTNLTFIILYTNSCMSALEFTMDEFLVPTLDTVTLVLSRARTQVGEVHIE